METAHQTPDVYVHVRIIIGIVLGLSISRLLTGLARFIQHPSREQIYAVHLAWVFFVLISVIHFWWFEFYLSGLTRWTFEVYVFVIFYASLYFLLCTLLFPDRMEEYAGFRGYFLSRRRWFFGLLALVFAADLVDSAIKGLEHFRAYGTEYPIRNGVFIALCLIAAFIEDRRFHAAFVAAALLYQVSWVLRQFETLS